MAPGPVRRAEDPPGAGGPGGPAEGEGGAVGAISGAGAVFWAFCRGGGGWGWVGGWAPQKGQPGTPGSHFFPATLPTSSPSSGQK